MGHTLVRERLNGTDGLNGNTATSENIRQIALSSRNYSAEMLKTEVLASVCDATDPADEQQACQVLSAWDNTGNLDARGAHIWTAFWELLSQKIAVLQRTNPALSLYATPFDAADPINTPNGLSSNATVQTQVAAAFSEAVAQLQNDGIALNARLRDIQFYLKPGEQIPQYGGEGSEGYFTVLRNSYMHVVDFPEGEPVRAFTLLSHSQSSDPASPNYSDYTEAYSNKAWHPFPFTREQIEDDLVSTTEISE